MTAQDELKRRAAERAVEFVRDGMVVGLGTGSTARHVVEVLAERVRSGALRDVVGVPTSRATERHAREVGIPLATLDDEPRLDLAIDGADEVDPNLDLIKGLGGALLWEKIVATASDQLVIVVDSGKLVDRLGRRSPVPVEVVPFGWTTHVEYVELLGARPTLRRSADGEPFRTDSGNYILDCAFDDGLTDAARIEREFQQRVGIIESGLFLGMADFVVVGDHDGVRVLRAEAQ
ncbi:MAG TPA: ribose-5-phosphate isomerase RpiA [Longimicrobiales bacterium]|nr:ribose-5-phosphate isomerase RpiA [Longimicrobiales bacterium]